MAGEHERIDGLTNPGFACITGRHLDVDIYDDTRGVCAGGWCLWCGTGSYDSDRITMQGEPVDFTPRLAVRIPEGFHRDPRSIES